MHEKRFSGGAARLREPERVARLEVARVAGLCLAGAEIRSVLDVGTGSGLFAEAFAGHGLDVAGVDANPDMVEAARIYVPGGQFQEAPAEALPYPDESFDLVFLGLLLHESDEPLQVLREVRRVTRRQAAVLEWPYQEETFGPPLAHRISPGTMIGLIRQAGFSQAETLPLANLVLYRLTR